MVRLLLAVALGTLGVTAAAAQVAPQAATAPAADAPIRDPRLLSSRPEWVSGTMPADLPVVQAAAAQGRSGRIKLTAVVRTDGTLRDVVIAESSGNPAIDAAVLTALQGWKLTPARDRSGKLVEAVATMPFALGGAPRKLSGSAPAFPDEARALGHNGKVVVKAVIAESGALTDVAVAQSSGSPLLDQAALEALSSWRYAPPLDLQGHARTVELSMPFKFSQAESGTGTMLMGMRSYGCAAFIKETDWWLATHPDVDPSKQEFYSFIVGALYMAPEAFGLRPGAQTDIRALLARHRQSWANAITRCRADPASTFLAEYRKG